MRKVLIIFTDPQLAYSPSTLNLYDFLKEKFDVSILSFEPDVSYSSQKVIGKRIKYLKRPDPGEGVPLLKRILKEIEKTVKPEMSLKKTLLTTRAKKIIEEVRKFEGEVIAVDFFALWCVEQAGKKAHLLSLEILENDLYRNECDSSKIKSVIIQTEERYRYLFKNESHNVFYVQNAPGYLETDLRIKNRNPFKLIFCGSAMPVFGIISCIEYIIDFPLYSLTVKGAVPPFIKQVIDESYNWLLSEGRLILNESYLNPVELNQFLTDYYIGFVFYDTSRYTHINSFNYKTAPSGKLFQLYNAGVPVVASNLPGLQSVHEYNAGVLLKSLGSSEIAKAIRKISDNYESFTVGAKKASSVFDFEKPIKEFINFLDNLE